jgi:hypothetical protein
MKKITLGLFLLASVPLVAQDTPQPVTVEILKKDGEKIKGKVIQIQRDTAEVHEEEGGILRIPMADIRNIDYLDGRSRLGKDWFPHPNALRYFLTSSAIPMKQNEAMLGSTYLFITTVHYGVSDRVSIGGGGDIFTGSVIVLNAKVNIMNGARHKFSTGLNYFRLPKDFIETYSGEDVRDLAMLSATSTWGNRNNNFTLGTGYMYFRGGFVPPIVTVAGSVRALEQLSFVTENWFLFVGERTGIPVIVSLGARYLGRRSTFDFGLYGSYENRLRIIFPYIAYSLKIGSLFD